MGGRAYFLKTASMALGSKKTSKRVINLFLKVKSATALMIPTGGGQWSSWTMIAWLPASNFSRTVKVVKSFMTCSICFK